MMQLGIAGLDADVAWGWGRSFNGTCYTINIEGPRYSIVEPIHEQRIDG